MISIYFFVPCYNESLRFDTDRWIRFISSLDFGSSVNFKFFFINDGSTDNTFSILNQLLLSNSKLKKSSISIINFDINIGKGVSLKRAINRFGGSADYVFYIDILEIINLSLTHKYDGILASRIIRKGFEARVGLTRRLISRIFVIVRDLLIPLGYRDTQCGLKSFKVTQNFIESVGKSIDSRWLFDLSLLVNLELFSRNNSERILLYEFPLSSLNMVPNSRIGFYNYFSIILDLTKITYSRISYKSETILP